MIKKEIRVLGIACAFPPNSRASTHVVGVVCRGNRWLEGAMRTVIPREGTSLTLRIIEMAAKSPHYPQLRAIVLDELILKSGMYIDIRALSRKTRLPVVATLCRKVSVKCAGESRSALRNMFRAFSDLRYVMWRRARKTFFVYFAGLEELDLNELLEVCASKQGVPEAAKIARVTCSCLEKSLSVASP